MSHEHLYLKARGFFRGQLAGMTGRAPLRRFFVPALLCRLAARIE